MPQTDVCADAPLEGYALAYLDETTKRMIRRGLLKAGAIPGYQVPFASREMPMPCGWGTGGIQVTASILGRDDVLKVIDQGSDDTTNAVSIRDFFRKTTGVATTTHTDEATIIQTRHRIPEQPLTESQIMVYQVPLPEPLRWVGRLAAPIFLCYVVEGFGRTRNYKKYLLRVYAVAAGMGITNALLRQYAGGLRPDGITPTNGICATFFLLLVILQGLKRMEQRRWDGILLVAGPFVLPLLLEAVLPTAAASLLTTTLLPSPYTCEGGIEFLMIGVLLYFFRRERSMQLTAYVVSCLVLYLTPILLLNGSPVTLLFTYYQWMMVFAAIPLAMYNGERGNSPRWLFYWFYPAHVYLLWARGALLLG